MISSPFLGFSFHICSSEGVDTIYRKASRAMGIPKVNEVGTVGDDVLEKMDFLFSLFSFLCFSSHLFFESACHCSLGYPQAYCIAEDSTELSWINFLNKLSWLVLCELDTCQGETSPEEMPPLDWAVGKPAGHFLN